MTYRQTHNDIHIYRHSLQQTCGTIMTPTPCQWVPLNSEGKQLDNNVARSLVDIIAELVVKKPSEDSG